MPIEAAISTMSYPTRLYVNGVEVRIKITMNYESDAAEVSQKLAEQIAAHIQKFRLES